MVEIILVRLAPPEIHVRDLKVAPEMTCRVTARLLVVLRPLLCILQPLPRIDVVTLDILRMRFDKSLRFRPQGWHGLRSVVKINSKSIGLVVVLHVAENVVVYIAEEVDFGFDAPVVADMFQGRMFVEETAVPPAHLVVGDQVPVLDVLLHENLGRLFEEIEVDPSGDIPVFLGYRVIVAFRLGFGGRAPFELFCEGDIVEECPGVIEFRIPRFFKVPHGLDHAVYFLVAD